MHITETGHVSGFPTPYSYHAFHIAMYFMQMRKSIAMKAWFSH